MTEKLALIIPAAGEGRRFGGAKQCAQWNGMSLLRRAAIVGLELDLSVIVVTGAYEERVSAELADLRVTRLNNANWSKGLGESIACAFRWLATASEEYAAAILMLADQPLVSGDELARLMGARTADRQAIWVADYGENRGPPCLFPRKYFLELSKLTGERGAKVLLGRHRKYVRALAMPLAGIDIDSESDLIALVRGVAKQG